MLLNNAEGYLQKLTVYTPNKLISDLSYEIDLAARFSPVFSLSIESPDANNKSKFVFLENVFYPLF